MKTLKSVLKLYIILSLLALPVIAVENYNLLKPGMGSKWLNEVGVDVQDSLTWILAGLVAAVVVAFIFFQLAGLFKAFGSTGEIGNSEKKIQGQNAIIMNLVYLFLVVLCIKVGLKFFGWF